MILNMGQLLSIPFVILGIWLVVRAGKLKNGASAT
jgi:prolipoprotein diacylglyceryltransferase